MTDRTTELRHALVTTVDAAAYQRRGPRRQAVIAAVAAFAIAGAATGGAVATTLSGSDGPTPDDVALSGRVSQTIILGTHADVFGEPVNFLGQGTTTVDLGEIPDGATQLALALDCVDAGDYEMSIDGEWQMGAGCDDESVNQLGGSGGPIIVTGSGTHTLTITGPGRYIVWAQWSAEHPVPPTSEAQAEAMADGVVTREEYVAGFDRFKACMIGAGYHVDGGNRQAPIISYAIPSAAVDDGTERRCYEPEYMLIDTEWQLAHEDESSSTEFLRQCLREHGIEPAYPSAEVDQQLADNSIDPLEDCLH
jgi:hypothetical protein